VSYRVPQGEARGDGTEGCGEVQTSECGRDDYPHSRECDSGFFLCLRRFSDLLALNPTLFASFKALTGS